MTEWNVQGKEDRLNWLLSGSDNLVVEICETFVRVCNPKRQKKNVQNEKEGSSQHCTDNMRLST